MRGKKVSTDLKYAILALGSYHTVSEIEKLTAVSRRQIYRIRASWETSGCVEPEHAAERRGRPRFLTTDEEAASFLFISQNFVITEMIRYTSMWLDASNERPTSTLKTSNPR